MCTYNLYSNKNHDDEMLLHFLMKIFHFVGIYPIKTICMYLLIDFYKSIYKYTKVTRHVGCNNSVCVTVIHYYCTALHLSTSLSFELTLNGF